MLAPTDALRILSLAIFEFFQSNRPQASIRLSPCRNSRQKTYTETGKRFTSIRSAVTVSHPAQFLSPQNSTDNKQGRRSQGAHHGSLAAHKNVTRSTWARSMKIDVFLCKLRKKLAGASGARTASKRFGAAAMSRARAIRKLGERFLTIVLSAPSWAGN